MDEMHGGSEEHGEEHGGQHDQESTKAQ